jgi:hypothetical protein
MQTQFWAIQKEGQDRSGQQSSLNLAVAGHVSGDDLPYFWFGECDYIYMCMQKQCWP